MPKVFVTRQILDSGIKLLQEKGYEVDVSPKDGVLTHEELIAALKAKPYDAVLSLLTDKIDGEVMDAVPTVKIFANYAVGTDNLNIPEAKKRNILLSNTPGVLTDAVAEQVMALLFATAKRVPEADKFMREEKFQGWAPMLFIGQQVTGKTLGIIGFGRIGSKTAMIAARGLGMKVVYYDVKRNEELEQECGAVFESNLEEVLKISDFVSINVPLTPETKHLINCERLALMKKDAILINTSRGPVVDEAALVEALKNGTIAGAGLDVFEFEPKMVEGLKNLPNVVLTPHTASATRETRELMSQMAAQNIIAVLEGQAPLNPVA